MDHGSPQAPGAPDEVQLLDDAGHAIGAAPRAQVHTTTTPLHLAFSCYVTRADGDLLMTRRALTKRTWPGVWTNSFCGHPRPGEPVENAIDRHARSELGIGVEDVVCVLPDFRYRATDASGVVENEVCPVYLATTGDEPDPSPDEVMELAWVDPGRVRHLVEAAPFLVSPWMRLQLPALPSLGGHVLGAQR
jgi:isopentenyl-diphosphate Delta-isomerase